MTSPPPKLLPDERPKKKSTILPALITAGCLLLLLAGSLFGFASTGSFNGHNPWNDVFMDLAVVTFVFFLILVWFVLQ